MSIFNKKRTGKIESVPEKPLYPHIEVKRAGLFRYDIVLTTHPSYPYTTLFGSTPRHKYYSYNYETHSRGPGTLDWIAFGSQKHALAYAKRILNRYLRRVSYRNGVTLRIHGKLD